MKKKKPKYIWMLVTTDKYELPLCVADSSKELAEMVGTNEVNVRTAVAHAKRRGNNCKYKKIKID